MILEAEASAHHAQSGELVKALVRHRADALAALAAVKARRILASAYPE
jgi:hypothetical protein